MLAPFAKRCLLSIFICACLFSDFSRALNVAYRYGKTSVEMLRNKKDAPRPMDDSMFRDKVVAINENQVRLRRSGKEITFKFHELTADDGAAFATSTYNVTDEYKAGKAFKIQGAGSKTYWCSKGEEKDPIYLWFQFKEPKQVTKIHFEEQYKLDAGQVYEVFGSNILEHCENPSMQTILTTGTADVFSGGKEFENKIYFYCYGLKMQNPTGRYIAVKRLQFAFKDSCDSTWTAGNHFRKSPNNCKIYAEKQYCAHQTYGSGWKKTWGKFKDFADSQGRTALICPECGCTEWRMDECCKKDDPKCFKYEGTKSTTSSGKKCQGWNQQSPHKHGNKKSNFVVGDFETNYCRNPDDSPYGAWCYTMDKNKRWEYCGIPTCQAQECCNPWDPYCYDYKGTKSTTSSGKTCQAWNQDSPHWIMVDRKKFDAGDLETNYCRTYKDKKPWIPGDLGAWCYTMDKNTWWEYCNIPTCQVQDVLRYVLEKQYYNKGCCLEPSCTKYSGINRTTITGKTCQAWEDSQNSKYNQQKHLQNYCRSWPDFPERGAWCFTKGLDWEKCAIPACPPVCDAYTDFVCDSDGNVHLNMCHFKHANIRNPGLKRKQCDWS